MNMWGLMLFMAVLAGAGGWVYDRYLAPHDAYDGQGNHDRLVIDAESRMAAVEAETPPWAGRYRERHVLQPNPSHLGGCHRG